MVKIAPLALLGMLAGCAGILGIPSDVDRETGTEEPESGMPDGTTPPEEGGLVDTNEDVDAAETGPVVPACDVAKAFGAPVPLQGVNTAEDEGSPHLSENELTLYLDALRSAKSPSYAVYFTTRSAPDGAFGPLQTFPTTDNSINAAGFDNTDANLTADQKTLVFERQNRATGDSDLYTATRSAPGLPFGTATSIANLNTANFEAEVFIRDDVTELWHARNINNSIDLALATLVAGTGYVIEPPTGNLRNVNLSTSFEGYPVISKNGLAIYFASDRPGVGLLDIYVATRGSKTDPFNAPVIVENVNSSANDYPGFISEDGCRLYLSSARVGGVGGQDLYVATRPK